MQGPPIVKSVKFEWKYTKTYEDWTYFLDCPCLSILTDSIVVDWGISQDLDKLYMLALQQVSFVRLKDSENYPFGNEMSV